MFSIQYIAFSYRGESMPHQSTPNERVRQSNEENLDMIGDLLIERIQSSKHLNASLQTQLSP